jgi:NADPH:quinone reductase-like Zn-dependent oxidoreductase
MVFAEVVFDDSTFSRDTSASSWRLPAMAVRLKPLNQQVMVITGASSGIGMATALAAGRQGAKVVLVSRNNEALGEVEKQIQAAGGTAMHIVADVSQREELQKVADTTIQHFGGCTARASMRSRDLLMRCGWNSKRTSIRCR